MQMLKRLEIVGFKSFARKTTLDFSSATTAIVGPNGSGKSNVAEAFRFALGEQSMKSMRGKRAEDLIFGGSHSVSRANRASVAIVFDNPDIGGRRPFKIDFDEVAIERVVHRDGTSEYSINGSRVRLRDIEELLAGANSGETGHQIISQGEADRILMASARERRAMLEDALGLAIYEFKKQEAQRKLEKTETNIAQVESLRRELAPHLRFLERQVEKLERTDALRIELANAAQTYFATEEAYLAAEKRTAYEAAQAAAARLAQTAVELAAIEENATTDAEGARRLATVRAAEAGVEKAAAARAELARELGRVEGALHAAKQRSARIAREPYAKVSREDLLALAEEAQRQLEAPMESGALRAALDSLSKAVRAFVDRFISNDNVLMADEEQAAYALENERAALLEREAQLADEQDQRRSALARSREALAAHDETGKEMRRRLLERAEAKAHEEARVERAQARLRELAQMEEMLELEKRDTVALAGLAALSYEPLPGLPQEEREAQAARRRLVERLRIRLEETGGTGEDVRQEHKEASERETFLARELEDLAKSADGLRSLAQELDAELAKHFADGLARVNASFGEFFAILFGGGHARLTLEESDADADEEPVPSGHDAVLRQGIEIDVALSKKKVRSLVQLSGGERALTSIALIFAMSQVNPPPFLILDETDAALDEANARRYGDMIESLAKKSQLIVITHNRETMRRAGILYGVTMGGDGVSKLLSVKFEDAVAVAK